MAVTEDDPSAVLDELSRNFTYWEPGPGNGSLSSAWYRRNQEDTGRLTQRRRKQCGHRALVMQPQPRNSSSLQKEENNEQILLWSPRRERNQPLGFITTTTKK